MDPFREEYFVKLGTNVQYSENVHHFVNSIPEIGQHQYEEFVKNRLIL